MAAASSGGGETQKDPSGWTVDTLRTLLQGQLDDMRIHLQTQLGDMRSMLQERYETQSKAVDAAFVAQQVAMSTALTAAERAVSTAMLAAEKAVDKAEDAATKRFEAVNEFRGQLADQAQTFIPRVEAEQRLSQNAEKITVLESRVAVDIAHINSRLDLSTGAGVGIQKAWAFLVAAVVAVVAVITVALTLTR